MDDGDAGLGLRERKKLATRSALSWAAVRLVVQRGFDNVRIEDIAADVGVSPRTFNNYFSSKAEAIVARHLDRVTRVAAGLRDRPPEEPLWEAITAAIRAQFGADPDPDSGTSPDPDHERWAAGVRLMMAEPALQGEFSRAGAIAETELVEAIAARTGTRPDDMYPRLVAGVIGVVSTVATHQWLHADPPVPLESLLREALARVSAGLPDPRT